MSSQDENIALPAGTPITGDVELQRLQIISQTNGVIRPTMLLAQTTD